MENNNENFEEFNQRMIRFLRICSMQNEKNNENVNEKIIRKVFRIKPFDEILKNGISHFLSINTNFVKTKTHIKVVDKMYQHYLKNNVDTLIDKENFNYIIKQYEKSEQYEKCHKLINLHKNEY